MSLQVENLEKNMAKLTIEVPASEFEKALQSAYKDVYKRQENIQCVTGLNLPMLINVLENRTEISLNSLPEVAMEGGKNGIVNMKELIS